MWFMDDGGPTHFSSAVRDVLSSTYHNWRVGREAPTVWPPCSPNLNLLNFYQWGHSKPLCI
jgi:hypothetical protein